MTKKTKKNKQTIRRRKRAKNSDESWTADKKLMVASIISGPNPFSKEGIRELLHNLQAILQHNKQDELQSRKYHTSEIIVKLYIRKWDIIEINERLQKFIDIQKKKDFAAEPSSTWRMPKVALKHLIELNLEIEKLLKRIPPSWEALKKEKFDVSGLLDMVRRSSKEL